MISRRSFGIAHGAWLACLGAGLLVLVATPPSAYALFAPSPEVESESVSRVTATDATLEARINPNSLEAGSHYQFQVVESPSEYPSKFACRTGVFPAGSSLCLGMLTLPDALPFSSIEAGVQGRSVSLDLSKAGLVLMRGTTYHYRVITARIVWTLDVFDWEEPIVAGSDQTFVSHTEAVPDEEPPPSPEEPPPNPEEHPPAREEHPPAREEHPVIDEYRPGASGGAASTGSSASEAEPSLLAVNPSRADAKKLKAALRACRKKPKHTRAACERRARRAYGPRSSSAR